MGIVQLLSAFFYAVKEVFGFQSKRLDAKNTDAMKKAELAQKEQDKKDAINKAIRERNEDEIRKGLS